MRTMHRKRAPRGRNQRDRVHAASIDQRKGTDEVIVADTLVVVHTRDMSDDDFAKHMTLRHPDSLGDLTHLDWKYMGLEKGYNLDVVRAWRAFHRRLHQLRVDLSHDHDW